MQSITFWRTAVLLLSLAAIGFALWQLFQERDGLSRADIQIGQTPATLIEASGDPNGPLVVIAHGFAGSQQLMQAYAYTLAQSGYRVLTFDFEGHGRNAVPMSGDVSAPDGTTRKLIDQVSAVIEEGYERTGETQVALLGHSMATDVLARVAGERSDVAAVVGISMFSQAVTPEVPERLLMITGAAEPHLREFAVGALQEVSDDAEEGETARSGNVVRRAVVAPGVEHVGVLYSATALNEARAFLDETFERQSDGPVLQHGPAVALLLLGLVALAWPLSSVLAPSDEAPLIPSWPALIIACLLPAVASPLILSLFETRILPVLVADYLALHLALYGGLLGMLLSIFGVEFRAGKVWPVVPLLAFGLGAFGLALDMFGASFVPHAGRWPIVGAIALGAVPFMLADTLAIAAGHAGWLKRLFVRLCFLGSLGLAVWLDYERLFFLALIVPVILLYFAVFGSMGVWVGRRSGILAPGLGLGLILAWSLGVSFPLFAQ